MQAEMKPSERRLSLLEMLCGLLVTAYLAGSLLYPPLEKVGQIGLLLWALGFVFLRPWRSQPVSGFEWALMASFVGFVLAAALSYALSEGGHDGSKMLGRYAKFLLFLPLFLLFRRFATARWLFLALLIVGLGNGLWAVLEYLGWAESYVGDKQFAEQVNAALNPIQYGNIVLAMTAMLLAGLGLFRAHSHWLSALVWVVVGLGFFAVFASGTRGALVSMPLMGLVALYISWRNGGLSWTPAILLFVVAMAALPSSELLWERANRGAVEFQTVDSIPEDVPTSVGTRLHMWRASWALFLEAPILGVGPGQYEARTQAMYEQGKANYWAVYHHPHSEYFLVLSTRGLVGLAALGAMLLVPLLFFWRHVTATDPWLRATACAGVMLVLEIGQAGLTESVFRLSSTMGIYIMGIALLAAIVSRLSDHQRSE